MLKVMTILGTRPEIIRLSRITAALDRFTQHSLVHTGQNYDEQLNDVFFAELGIRPPDHHLGVDTSSLGRSLGDILIKTEAVLLKERPDAVLVLGDTNSAIATLMAKRMKIPTYHMEAGNRSFDANVPEEINRRMVDHLADFNLVYTEHARRHLLSEGIQHRFIYLTGSPMREVLDHMRPQILRSDVLSRLGLKPQGYFIVSVHREENVDSRTHLQKILSGFSKLVSEFRMPVIVSTHPRTRARLEAAGLGDAIPEVRFLPPFGFVDYNQLQLNAFCAVSDSGTISEEAAILRFPAVSIRRSIERPEALDAGSISLTGFDEGSLVDGINIAVARRAGLFAGDTAIPEEYRVNNTSERVVRLIVGTAKLAAHWRNMDSFSRYDWD